MKNKKTIIIATILVITTLVFVLFMSLIKFKDLEEIAKNNIYGNDWNSQIARYNYNFAICDYGLLKTEAVITLQTSEDGFNNSFYFVRYERDNIFSNFFNITNQKNGDPTLIRGMSYDEALTYKGNKNCSDLKVNDSKLIYFPPPSSEEIEANEEKERQIRDARDNNERVYASPNKEQAEYLYAQYPLYVQALETGINPFNDQDMDEEDFEQAKTELDQIIRALENWNEQNPDDQLLFDR